MFSRVSVNLFTGGDISGPMSFLGVGISGTRSLPGGGSVQWVGEYVQGEGWVCPGGTLLDMGPQEGGEDTTRYGWQAGSTYPTGLPCSNLQIVFIGVN